MPTWFDADSCSSIQEDPQAWSNMTCRCGSVDIMKRGAQVEGCRMRKACRQVQEDAKAWNSMTCRCGNVGG